MSAEEKTGTEPEISTKNALEECGEAEEDDSYEDIEYYGIGYDDIENVNYYNRGGHHPVHLGDILNGQYEVVHKLGSGGFGLVWLCQHTVTKKWSAIKITAADHSAEGKEKTIYDHLLRISSSQKLKENHLLMPSDQFWIEGPNGRHYCLVLPVMGQTAWSWATDKTIGRIHDDVRKVCAQIVQGVRFLHRYGVCHGDLKPGNVLMEVQGLDELSKDQMLQLLGDPKTCEIETESGKPPGSRAPKYVVVPSWNAWWEGRTVSSAAIIDFSASFLASDPPDLYSMSLGYAPPEVIWRKTFQPGPHSDIWSLAVTLYEMIGHGSLFAEGDITSTLSSFELFLGGLPEPYRSVRRADRCAATGRPVPDLAKDLSIDEAEWEKFPLTSKWNELLEWRERFVKETGYSDHLEASLGGERQYSPNIGNKDLTGEERYKTIKHKLPREDVLEFSDLFRKMLRYDPTKRMNIDKVISHPCIKKTSSSLIAISSIMDRIPPKEAAGVSAILRGKQAIGDSEF
ncbi:kinase-like protein [Nemania serpens]|nr:kinase-like protein [Nemania serpens]